MCFLSIAVGLLEGMLGHRAERTQCPQREHVERSHPDCFPVNSDTAKRTHGPQHEFAQRTHPDYFPGNSRKADHLPRCWGVLVRY